MVGGGVSIGGGGIGQGVTVQHYASGIGQGATVNYSQETFHGGRSPVEIHLNGFGVGKRLRIVGIPVQQGTQRFQINFHTPHDNIFHFNPRFDENGVISNSTRNGAWQSEERQSGNPFHYNEIFTIEFVPHGHTIAVFVNGHLYKEFGNRADTSGVNRVEIHGDVRIHSSHYTQ